jgi:hypothetical protein
VAGGLKLGSCCCECCDGVASIKCCRAAPLAVDLYRLDTRGGTTQALWHMRAQHRLVRNRHHEHLTVSAKLRPAGGRCMRHIAHECLLPIAGFSVIAHNERMPNITTPLSALQGHHSELMHCCRGARGCASAQLTGRLAAAGPMAAAAPGQKTLTALHRTAQLTAAPFLLPLCCLPPGHRQATQRRQRWNMAPPDRRHQPPTLQRTGSCRCRRQAGCGGRWPPSYGSAAAAGSRRQRTRCSASGRLPLRAKPQGETCNSLPARIHSPGCFLFWLAAQATFRRSWNVQ